MTSPDDTMTDAEAEAMLQRLAKHYRQPVLPMNRYCDALRLWADLIKEGNLPGRSERGMAQGSDYAEYLHRVLIDISKSNFLARVLYGGEKLRTKPCPEHKGHWRGIFECEYGCDQTGWIPEPEDRPTKDQLTRAIAAVETRRANAIDKWGNKFSSDFDDRQIQALRSTLAYFYPEDPNGGINAPFTPENRLVVVVSSTGTGTQRAFYISTRLDFDMRLRTGKDNGNELANLPEDTIVQAIKFTEALFDRLHTENKLTMTARDLGSVRQYVTHTGRSGLRLGDGHSYKQTAADIKALTRSVKEAVEALRTESPVIHCTIDFFEVKPRQE